MVAVIAEMVISDDALRKQLAGCGFYNIQKGDKKSKRFILKPVKYLTDYQAIKLGETIDQFLFRDFIKDCREKQYGTEQFLQALRKEEKKFKSKQEAETAIITPRSTVSQV